MAGEVGLTADISRLVTELGDANTKAAKLGIETSLAVIRAKQEGDAMKNIR